MFLLQTASKASPTFKAIGEKGGCCEVEFVTGTGRFLAIAALIKPRSMPVETAQETVNRQRR